MRYSSRLVSELAQTIGWFALDFLLLWTLCRLRELGWLLGDGISSGDRHSSFWRHDRSHFFLKHWLTVDLWDWRMRRRDWCLRDTLALSHLLRSNQLWCIRVHFLNQCQTTKSLLRLVSYWYLGRWWLLPWSLDGRNWLLWSYNFYNFYLFFSFFSSHWSLGRLLLCDRWWLRSFITLRSWLFNSWRLLLLWMRMLNLTFWIRRPL